jgi:hypothetical protein
MVSVPRHLGLVLLQWGSSYLAVAASRLGEDLMLVLKFCSEPAYLKHYREELKVPRKVCRRDSARLTRIVCSID